MQDKWTILNTIKWTSKYFTQYGINTPRLDAELLLAHTLKTERTQLYVRFDQPLQKYELADFKKLILRRIKREPVAYILGKKEFWSLDFKVNPYTLIPRPETELLVQKIIDLYNTKSKNQQIILDICTGCGNIAISLASELKHVKILGSDISEWAIKTAQANAELHEVDEIINFHKGDLFDAFRGISLTGKVDFIVSNPPYIPTAQLKTLAPEIGFEPITALDGGQTGACLQERIIDGALNLLTPGGCLVMETGIDQVEHIMSIGKDNPLWKKFSIIPDYSGLPRVVLAKKAI